MFCVVKRGKITLITFAETIIALGEDEEEGKRHAVKLSSPRSRTFLHDYLCLKASSLLSPRSCGDYIVIKSWGIYMRNVRNKILMRGYLNALMFEKGLLVWLTFHSGSLFLPRRQKIMWFSLRRMNPVTLTFLTFFLIVECGMKRIML